MFTVVLSVCLLVEPNACTIQPANLPIQETFSDCLDAANAEAAPFNSLHPERMIALIYCKPCQPGQGR